MDVHPGAIDAEDRLGHERRVQPVLLGDRLERELEGDGVVGGAQRVRVLKIDLVLPLRDFVVSRLDPDTEPLEGIHHVLADLLSQIGGEVEVAGLVVREWFDPAALAAAKQEELQLWPGVDDEPELPGAVHLATQDVAWVTDERLAIGREHVADDPGGAPRSGARLPRDLREGVHVRHQVLVGFGDPGEAFDGRAIEPGPVLDRSLQSMDRDRHGLDMADDVRELQLDEADPGCLRGFDLRGRFGALGHWPMPPWVRCGSLIVHGA